MLVQEAPLPLRQGVCWGELRRTGTSGHAGHLTGCGGRLWRERWLNGSDVGRLQGTVEVGNIRTGGLVTHRTGLTPTSKVRLRSHFHTAAPAGFTPTNVSCFCLNTDKHMRLRLISCLLLTWNNYFNNLLFPIKITACL